MDDFERIIEEELTYTEVRGNLIIIDYVLGDEEIREKVERLDIGEDIDSDNHLVIVWMKWKRSIKRRNTANSGMRGEAFRTRMDIMEGKRGACRRM